MLRHKLIHPKINEVLGRAGHHGKILIADGNYPSSSAIGPRAELVSLNLEPIPKWDFYKAVETPDHILTIQTADQQRFANLLLLMGVRID